MTLREAIVAKAKEYIGTPYNKLDCSAFVRAVYRNFGFEFVRVSSEQAKQVYNMGLAEKIDKSLSVDEIIAKLKPGDPFWWSSTSATDRWLNIHHVAINIGNGKAIESAGTIDGVDIRGLWETSKWQIVMIADITSVLKYDGEIEESGDEEMIQYTPGMAFDAETKEYQLSLIGLGFPLPKYGADGKFGGETLGAHNDFQVSAGLPKTKVVDVETQAAMFKAQREKSSGYSDEEIADMIKAKLNAEAELAKANNIISKAQSALNGF